MKRKIDDIENINKDENPFALSTGDLMAGIMFVFVLLLVVLMVRVREKEEIQEKQTTDYQLIKKNLAKKIENRFNTDFVNWKAEFDSTNLCIHFYSDDFFKKNETRLEDSFKKTLDSFFIDFVNIVYDYKNDIEEIRIEGHASSDGDYAHNMDLSQKRAYSVFDYCIDKIKKESDKYNWFKDVGVSIGYSSSRPYKNNDIEVEEKSRRVDFAIKTNAEAKMEEIIEKLKR